MGFQTAEEHISYGLAAVALVIGAVLSLLFMVMEWLFIIPVAALALLLFLVFDGYKALYILFKTAPRDIRAGFCLLRVLTHIRRCEKNNITVTKLFSENVAKYPNKICLMFGDQRWTFTQLDEYSNRVANLFLSKGFQKGDPVALFMENRPEYVGIWLGLAKAGILPALINFNLRLKPFEHSITVINAKALIFGAELSQAVADVSEGLVPELPKYCSGADQKEPSIVPGAENLDSLLQMSSPLPCEDRTNYKDKLLYIYTSGTTGLPKAAVIAHSRFIYYTDGIHWFFGLRHSDVIYSPLPLYHTAGGMLGAGQVLLFGCTAALRAKFSASNYWKDAVTFQCTAAQYIGELCRYLLSAPPRPEDTQHKVKVMFGNGLRPQIWEQFQKRFNIPRICEFYGSTEGNANIVNMENKIGAVGFVSRIVPAAYPVTLIKLDQVTGEPLRDKNGVCIRCKPGEPGEFVGKIISNHPLRAFDGYADKTATEKKVVRDVWKKGDLAFRSGDTLVMDILGYFYFLDRTGDTFRWRGENVSTSEVEAMVSNICNLTDATVYGVQIPGLEGKAGMAAILDPEGSLDLVALAEGCKKMLPSYAHPLFIRLVKVADLTGTFKLKKVDLKKQGFNIKEIQDKVFFLDSSSRQYVPLTPELYANIMEGRLRL